MLLIAPFCKFYPSTATFCAVQTFVCNLLLTILYADDISLLRRHQTINKMYVTQSNSINFCAIKIHHINRRIRGVHVSVHRSASCRPTVNASKNFGNVYCTIFLKREIRRNESDAPKMANDFIEYSS